MTVSRIFAIEPLSREERVVLRVQIMVFVAVSLLLSLGYYEQRVLRTMAEREHVELLVRGWDGFAWVVWLLAAPAMLLLIRRFPIQRGQIGRNLIGLIIGSFVIYAFVTNARFFLRVLPNVWLPDRLDAPVDWSHYIISMLFLLPMDFMTYCGFFSASFAINYYFKYRHRVEETLQLQVRTAELQSELARAELTALRGQLHPHFLFNSFNAVASLVRQKRNEAAVEVIAQLSALLRLAMERTGQQELSLDDEVDFVRRYLEIERVRFGEKLRLDFALDPAALGASVPNLLLQPLVENAIKHGISMRTRPGTVRLVATCVGSRLKLEIANDGPDQGSGQGEPLESRKGIGLANTHARLEKIYGKDYTFELMACPEGGTLVRLDLPLRLGQSFKTVV
ncbi:MAG: signal transduction histidine kinase, LytS [Verrucomicrobia bacterium]|nr:signal transduction histidine kinase, LytS [Verrucomicrobiota bacterium]